MDDQYPVESGLKFSRSQLNAFEASEQMRKDDQLLTDAERLCGQEAKTPVTVNPLLFKSVYRCLH